MFIFINKTNLKDSFTNILNFNEKVFIKRNNLGKIIVHSLRHTISNLMITHITDIRTETKRLGHSSTNTTTKIY